MNAEQERQELDELIERVIRQVDELTAIVDELFPEEEDKRKVHGGKDIKYKMYQDRPEA